MVQGSNLANHHKYFQRQTLFSQFYIWKKIPNNKAKKPKKVKGLARSRVGDIYVRNNIRQVGNFKLRP